jgi:hypothetical protein
VWTLLPEVARACQETLKCGCKALPLCSKKCNAKMLDFHAQVFATVVEHATVNFIKICLLKG